MRGAWGKSKGGLTQVKTFVYQTAPPPDAETAPQGAEHPPHLQKNQWFHVLEVLHGARWISVRMRTADSLEADLLEGWVNVWNRQNVGSCLEDDTGLMVCIPKTWQAGGGGRRGIRTSSCGCQPGKLANWLSASLHVRFCFSSARPRMTHREECSHLRHLFLFPQSSYVRTHVHTYVRTRRTCVRTYLRTYVRT